MNDTPTPTREELEVAVADAATALTEAKAAIAVNKEALKGAKTRVKNIELALKALADTPENADERAKGAAALEEAKAAVTSADVAHATAKGAADTAAETLKQAKANLRGVPKTAAPRPERVSQNGVPLPKEGTISAALWSIFDDASKVKGSPAAFQDILAPAQAAGVKETSIRAGYAHWRKFHGVTGRVAPVKEPEPAGEPAAA